MSAKEGPVNLQAHRTLKKFKEEGGSIEFDNWEPIETAPQDGTRVLIYERRYGTMEFARWIGAPHNHWGDGYKSWKPTHWMPLPEPPLT